MITYHTSIFLKAYMVFLYKKEKMSYNGIQSELGYKGENEIA